MYCVLYIAHCPRPTGSGRMQFGLMREESAAFAMPCHARHCATLVAGSQQGRTKRPLAIGGPCRAQNLRPIDQVRAPSSDQVPKSLPPPSAPWCVLRIALHCSARHGHGEKRSRVCSTCSTVCLPARRSPRRAKYRLTETSTVEPWRTWNAVFLHMCYRRTVAAVNNTGTHLLT